MNLSSKAQGLYAQITSDTAKLGDLKKIAKEIKKDHDLAMELWSTNEYYPRLLATLIIDKKLLSPDLLNDFAKDLKDHTFDERIHIMEWLMANQLMKDKNTMALMQSWENSASPLQRRTYWYYQARLRWMGNTNHSNTEDLLTKIESNLLNEEPEVQWAMNFTAGQIGKWQEEYRDRCIAIGEDTGLYKDEVVPRGCTPSYLPKFIPIEVAKLK